MAVALPEAGRQFITVRRLPDPKLDELWNVLYFPSGIPERGLRYLDTLTRLGQAGVSATRLALNRAVLFFGPPGTGKTSFAEALPNVWARERGQEALLAIFHTHNLPSAERGATERNVAAAFAQLAELAALGLPLFCIADEVENAATDRASVNPATNPLDTLYGVDAFIKEFDTCVQRHPNVVFLFTSNLPRFIDRSITERVDFEEHIPLPTADLRRRILADAVASLPVPTAATGRNGGADSGAGVAAVGTGSQLPGQCHDHGAASGVSVAADGLGMPLYGPAWDDLIRLTDGFSARQLRHLVVLALVLAADPDRLSTIDLLEAARHQLALQRHQEETGGIYVRSYQQ